MSNMPTIIRQVSALNGDQLPFISAFCNSPAVIRPFPSSSTAFKTQIELVQTNFLTRKRIILRNILKMGIMCIVDIDISWLYVTRQISTSAKEVARFQRFFPNPSWLTSGRTSGHQNFVSIFPGINNCLKAKC